MSDSFLFHCKSCKQKIKALDSSRGKKLSCPNCKQKIFVPIKDISGKRRELQLPKLPPKRRSREMDGGTIDSEPPVDAELYPTQPHAPSDISHNAKWLWLFIIVVAAIAVLDSFSFLNNVLSSGMRFKRDNAIGATANAAEQISNEVSRNPNNWIIVSILFFLAYSLNKINNKLLHVCELLNYNSELAKLQLDRGRENRNINDKLP